MHVDARLAGVSLARAGREARSARSTELTLEVVGVFESLGAPG